MRRSTFLTGLLTVPMFLAPHGRALGSDGLKAWLETTSKDGMLEFQGYVSAPMAMLVSYKLTIKRIGDGGTSSTAQSGRVQITIPNERTRLSLSAMNVGSRDHYEAELTAWGPSGEVVRVKLEQLPRI
jgi:hypothetical protein